MGHGHMVAGSGLSLPPAVSFTFVLEGNQTRRLRASFVAEALGLRVRARGSGFPVGPHEFSAPSAYSWKRNARNNDGTLGSPNFHSETVGDSQSTPLQPVFRQRILSLFQASRTSGCLLSPDGGGGKREHP